MKRILEQAGKWLFGGLSFVFLFYLFTVSLFGTCYMDRDELTYYCKDNPLIQGLFILLTVTLLTIAMWLFRRKRETIIKMKAYKIASKLFIPAVLLVFGTASLYLVLATQAEPISDQRVVLNAVEHMRSGNFMDFEPGQYLDRFPYLNGLVTAAYLLSFVFGTYSYVAFQIINVIASCLTVYYLIRIAKDYLGTNGILTGVSCVLFLPIVLYNTFVYGNVVGFAAAIAAVYFQFRFWDKYQMRDGIFSAICMTLSILLKSNYLIFLIGIALFQLWGALLEKRVKYLIALALMILLYFGSSFGVNAFITNLTGIENSGGVPKTGYLVIGLTPSEEKADGWYNDYNLITYTEAEYQNEVATQMVKERLHQQLAEYKSAPKVFLEFLSNKTLSQWNNPTFQGFWLYEYRDSKVEYSEEIENLLFGKTSFLLSKGLNILQSLVLFGALCYSILCFGKANWKKFLFQCLFIGGFLFYLAWEAKGQYTVVYFILLIPLAVSGYLELSHRILAFLSKQKAGKCEKVDGIVFLACLAFALILPILPLDIMRIAFHHDSNEDAYVQNVVEVYYRSKVIREGEYVITPYLLPEYSLSETEDGIMQIQETESLMRLEFERSFYEILTEENQAVELQDCIFEEGNSILANKENAGYAQQWFLKKQADGTYTISSFYDYVMQYDEETGEVTIGLDIGSPNQRWVIVRQNHFVK